MFRLLIYTLIMINPVTLKTKLAGLIGFNQPYNPAYQVLDAPNIASRSGYKVNDNPFIKIESIKDSQDYAGITDGDFNSFLRDKVGTSIINVSSMVFNENDYIDRQLIYANALNKFSSNPTPNTAPGGNFVNTYALPPGFSCYWFRVSKKKNITFKIERVYLEFNGVGDITLYLYNTGDLTTPLQTKTIHVTSPLQEVPLDWVCDNTGNGYKGDYYLGYFSTGMTIQPFKREYRDAVMMSNIDCIDYQRTNFAKFTKTTDAFDLLNYSPYLFYNGVNPDVTVYEDFTDLIIQNEKLFARAIQLDCQIAMLSESVASLRSNRNERISAQYTAQIMAQIEGETGEGNVKVKGLRPQFYGAISSIQKEMKKLRTGYTDVNQIRIETIS